jgi:hypothetical protein
MFKIGDRVIVTNLHYNKSSNISSRMMSCYNNIHPVYLNDIGTITRVENPLTRWGEQKTEYILCIVFDKYKISIPDYFHEMFQWRFSLAETPKGNKLIIKQ